MNKQQQSGFTLIELIAVIVILGILAATAIPKFVNLSSSATAASTQAVAGALGSAAALNHASATAVKAGLPDPTPAPVTVANCGNITQLLEGGALPADYVIDATTATTAAGASCTVSYDSNGNGNFDAADEPDASFTAYTSPIL